MLTKTELMLTITPLMYAKMGLMYAITPLMYAKTLFSKMLKIVYVYINRVNVDNNPY